MIWVGETSPVTVILVIQTPNLDKVRQAGDALYPELFRLRSMFSLPFLHP